MNKAHAFGNCPGGASNLTPHFEQNIDLPPGAVTFGKGSQLSGIDYTCMLHLALHNLFSNSKRGTTEQMGSERRFLLRRFAA